MKVATLSLLVLLLLLVWIVPYALTGNIVNLRTQGVERTAEEITRESLFDIYVTIPESYEHVHPDGELLASVKLINLGSAGRIDVILDYIILDASQETIASKKETVAVETQANFVRTFKIPPEAALGTYKIVARMTYANGSEAVAENSFMVIAEHSDDHREGADYRLLLIIILGCLFALLILIYEASRSRGILDKIRLRMQIRTVVRERMKRFR